MKRAMERGMTWRAQRRLLGDKGGKGIGGGASLFLQNKPNFNISGLETEVDGKNEAKRSQFGGVWVGLGSTESGGFE